MWFELRRFCVSIRAAGFFTFFSAIGCPLTLQDLVPVQRAQTTTSRLALACMLKVPFLLSSYSIPSPGPDVVEPLPVIFYAPHFADQKPSSFSGEFAQVRFFIHEVFIQCDQLDQSPLLSLASGRDLSSLLGRFCWVWFAYGIVHHPSEVNSV